MKAKQLRELIVRPLLIKLDESDLVPFSLVAEDLIVATACAESHCGHYIRQELNGGGYGVAEGIYQMEPSTENDIHYNFLGYRQRLNGFVDAYLPDHELYSLEYATFMCRMQYFRQPEALPALDISLQINEAQGTYVRDLGKYWKKYYNTESGAGTIDGFIEKCEKYGDFV